jgi:hypothetical protein
MKLFLTIVPELPALSWTCLRLPVETASADRLGKTARAIAKHANKAAALNEIYLDRNVLGGTGLDMDVPFTGLTGHLGCCGKQFDRNNGYRLKLARKQDSCTCQTGLPKEDGESSEKLSRRQTKTMLTETLTWLVGFALGSN